MKDNNMMVEILRNYGLYTTFQKLQGAKNTKEYWKVYLEDREKEENPVTIEDDGMPDFMSQILEMAFNSVKTEKMDQESEEYIEELAEKMNDYLEDSFKDEKFITEVAECVESLEYDPNDNESRCNFLATMLIMQKMIPSYNPKDEESEYKDIAKMWLPVKKGMASRLAEMTQDDYKMFYTSVYDIRDFFNEIVYLPVHTQKIHEMTEDEYVFFLMRTLDGLDGDNPIIKLAKKQKQLECDSRFIDEIYEKFAEYKITYSIEDFQKIDDNKKFLYLMNLKSYAEYTYMPYVSYTDEEKESGYKEKQENKRAEAMIASPEFKEYLKALSNITDEQFIYVIMNYLSSSTLMKMYGKESEIIQKRLDELSLIDLVAIGMKDANSSNSMLISAIAKNNGDTEVSDEITMMAEKTQKIYKCMSNVTPSLTYASLVIPRDGTFFDNKSTMQLMDDFDIADRLLKLDKYVITENKRLQELSNDDFIKEANKYNLRYTEDDVYVKPKTENWYEPETLEDKIGKANNWRTNYFIFRVLSLPKELKYRLNMVKNGILTNAIQVTRNNDIIQTIKDMGKTDKEDDGISLDE